MQFLSTLLTIVIIIYILGIVVRYLFPRIIVWLARRHVEKQMRETFGDQYQQRQQYQQQQQRQRSSWWPFGAQEQPDGDGSRPHGKIITNDVGEYVEFEEISTYSSTEEHVQKPRIKPESQVADADWEDL